MRGALIEYILGNDLKFDKFDKLGPERSVQPAGYLRSEVGHVPSPKFVADAGDQLLFLKTNRDNIAHQMTAQALAPCAGNKNLGRAAGVFKALNDVCKCPEKVFHWSRSDNKLLS